MRLCKNAYNRGNVEFQKVETSLGNFYIQRLVREPAGHITLEEFRPGEELMWPFWHHEVHVVISGSAELSVSSPPMMKTIDKFVTEPGDAYLMHRGDLIRFKVLSDEPYRHICVIMPAIPIPSGDHLVAEHLETVARY